MVSHIAKAAYDEWLAKGLKPTFADAIRINALGLKLEAAKAKTTPDESYRLPRMAKVSDMLSFRQPTIGHEIWLKKAYRFIGEHDYESLLAVRAYALSRAASELPDADDPKAIDAAISAFAAECGEHTYEQIATAIDYVVFGRDESERELAAKRKRDRGTADGTLPDDWDECLALGMLNEGRAVLWGMTAAELSGMTSRELMAVLRRAYFVHGLKAGDGVDRAEGEFFATADEIEERLTKDHGGAASNI